MKNKNILIKIIGVALILSLAIFIASKTSLSNGSRAFQLESQSQETIQSHFEDINADEISFINDEMNDDATSKVTDGNSTESGIVDINKENIIEAKEENFLTRSATKNTQEVIIAGKKKPPRHNQKILTAKGKTDADKNKVGASDEKQSKLKINNELLASEQENKTTIALSQNNESSLNTEKK